MGHSPDFRNIESTQYRNGGPYGDQSDAIRDETLNAAREGREPNYDKLLPDQYMIIDTKAPEVSEPENIVRADEVTKTVALGVTIPSADLPKAESLGTEIEERQAAEEQEAAKEKSDAEKAAEADPFTSNP